MHVVLTVYGNETFDATDLSYLLFKRPDRVQTYALPFGSATVGYPVVSSARTAVAMTVEANPVKLVRDSAIFAEYVNDRPYANGTLCAVALRSVFGAALSGKAPAEKSELAKQPIAFEVYLPAVPCYRGEALIRELFEPLGYGVSVKPLVLDEDFPDWGMSRLYGVTIAGTALLSELLGQIYILLPVLGNDKHYVINPSEVTKLIQRGAGWLENHPERNLIVLRYLRYQQDLADQAHAGLDQSLAEHTATEEAGTPEEEDVETAQGSLAEAPTESRDPERALRLHDKRHKVVADLLKARGAKTVADIGCGSGQLMEVLMRDEFFERIIGFEPYEQRRFQAKRRLKCGRRGGPSPERVRVMVGSATLPDSLLKQVGAATLIEVIEHLELSQVSEMARALFGYARPPLVVITTPNREYNCLFPKLPAGALRDWDHKFEWTRAEFEAWAQSVAERFSYSVAFEGIGTAEPHPEYGHPTQMAVFTRVAAELPASDMGANELTADELFAEKRQISTEFGSITVRGDAVADAFDLWSRSRIDRRWMAYIPPTMSPVVTRPDGDCLEHPAEAFSYYAAQGLKEVICQEKHMGSRAVIMLCRNAETAKARFGIETGEQGYVASRKGLPFFGRDNELERRCLERLSQACDRSGLWGELGSDWVLFDCEIMPWSAKARELLTEQYAPTAAAGEAALCAALVDADMIANRDLPESEHALALEHLKAVRERLMCVRLFRAAYQRYCWSTDDFTGLRIAPFHILASEGVRHTDKSHLWHMAVAERLSRIDPDFVWATSYQVVRLEDPSSIAVGTAWWEGLVGKGGEGMVVKPIDFIARNARKEEQILQPAVKVRGPEYLRIIYGPEYPRLIERLRERSVSAKRSLAMREFLLGIEGLRRLVAGKGAEHLADCVLGTLACEGGGKLDPRL